jgi:hypothetical protein
VWSVVSVVVALGCRSAEVISGPPAPPPPPPPPPSPRAGYYAAPGGSASWDGSPSRPWDLTTALAGGHGTVHPGDTIWLRFGTYYGGFRSLLTGTSGAPIVVRAYPGERAILDGHYTTSNTLIVDGNWTVFWGLELTNSSSNRTAARADVVANYASFTKYINLIIHDGGVAFYSAREETNVEIAGCIIYNNGWQESDRGHGHALYLKSDAGPIDVHDNILFNQYGYGVHAYSNRGAGELTGLHFVRNVAFNNGTLSNNSTSSNILVGGNDRADQIVLTQNVAYDSPGVNATNVQVGFDTVMNGSLALTQNHFVGGGTVLDVGFWTNDSVSADTLQGAKLMTTLHDPVTLGGAWLGNYYYRNPLDSAWQFANVRFPFLAWQLATGLGITDIAGGSSPTGADVYVWPDQYEPGRATVVVLNWSGASAVNADLHTVLTSGDGFAVHNVQQLFGSAVTSGTFGGTTITLPLTGVAPPVPTGLSSSRAPKTGPAFDVFVVTRL